MDNLNATINNNPDVIHQELTSIKKEEAAKMENFRRVDEVDAMSGDGYEQDDSRMGEDGQSVSSKEQKEGGGKRKGREEMPIAHKKMKGAPRANAGPILTDSGYDRDVSSDMNMPVYNSPPKKSDREEETQILPYALGSYVDHSLDPDDDRPFAPIHRKPNFPESLYAILSNPDLSKTIEWMPHGRSFIVLDREEFAKSVLPTYYRHSNLASFNRQLNGYGFKKIKIGPCEKTFYHPLFLRNLPHLVKDIKRSTGPSAGEQSILYESQLEKVSAERPLPGRMSPIYADHLKTMNRHIYQGLQLEKIGLRECSGKAAAPDASETKHEASTQRRAVPSVIYTPSPRPLPSAVYTPPPQLPPQQTTPSAGSMERQLVYSNAPSTGPTQGTVFTQTHFPLTGLPPNPAPIDAFLPAQSLPFQQQPVMAAQPVAAGQTSSAQTTQAQADALQAQIQLLSNAIAAQLGKNQYFQPVGPAPSSMNMSPPAAQPSSMPVGTAQQNANLLQQLLGGIQQQQQQQQQQPEPPQLQLQPQFQPQQQQSISGLGQIATNQQDMSTQPTLFGDISQLLMSPESSSIQPSQFPPHNIFPGSSPPGPSPNAFCQQGSSSAQPFPGASAPGPSHPSQNAQTLTMLDASQLLYNPSPSGSVPSTQAPTSQSNYAPKTVISVPPQSSSNPQTMLDFLRQQQQNNQWAGADGQRAMK